MPNVELLPNSTSTSAPGWTYVVDRGYDPSKIAINPKNKKRAAAQPGGPRGENELSARQQTAIARRVAELERDNDPKQSIPIPGKISIPKTQNTRRIIQYQRQIKHWLDDEEAMLSQAPPVRTANNASRAVAQPSRRQSTLMSIPPTPSEATPTPTAPTAPATTVPFPFGISPNDIDAMLSVESSMPPSLDPAELEALLAAPPLTYAASHVSAPPAGAPKQRQFCDNCGYWGKIKCLKCGTRICGLECKDAHEATRCLKWA
ncbi:hypothetical protein B0J11DRAFT_2784 [Dendryphion nanum]|uniref:HIT-type domain-containing protein n=1 Tax=Dendryphion nanum TaxID=256645 RepID=A0A9P9J0U9_9PLEO|nr:hypothetical protein B0J11DRAFT_2784 [Dendryphion nanum]